MSSKPTTPTPNGPVPAAAPVNENAAAIAEREKAERQEVAGRHKNDGQKPHKGAR